MLRRGRVPLVVSAVIVAMALFGCSSTPKEPAVAPKVAPPMISTEGILKAGVDMGYPPFAGVDEGHEVGLDVDVAAAIADRLGLELELVDVSPSEIASALESGKIDIALAAMPITDAILADVTVAGSYVSDGPALFSLASSATADATSNASGVGEVDPADLGALRVGAQKESAAWWKLESDYGEGFAKEYDSLRAAFQALEAGEVDVVAGDAIVGAYLTRDLPRVRYAGQLAPAVPLGVSVAKDATELEKTVRDVLDVLAADGVLDTIRTKWVGSLPQLRTASTESSATP